MNLYPRLWRKLLLFTVISFAVFVTAGPLFAQVTVFPLNYQLYPRNVNTNTATVRVNGSLNLSSGYTQVRLKCYRDGVLINTITNTLVYDGNNTAFYIFTQDITAELRNYTISLFGVQNSQETLIRSANNIVAGDAYIIQGQSNAVANNRSTSAYSTANDAEYSGNVPYGNFVRAFGSGSTTSSYTRGWFIAKANPWFDVDGQVGQWGKRMGSNIAGAHNIPIAIFNGGAPGEAIAYFQRNDGNPWSGSSNYGRLLTRINEAGLKNNIRALIWYQGESNSQGVLNTAQTSTATYKSIFYDLYNDWKQDFPGLNKFYIVQIRHGCGIYNADNTLKIQEAQRQLDKESSEIFTISSSNTNQLYESSGGLGYCHYNYLDGYKNIGDWVSNILRRDIYGAGLPATIEAPEPQSAAFSMVSGTGEATQVALTLKDQQGSFSMNGDLKNLFRLDGGTYTISSVSLTGSTIYINFSRQSGTSTNPTGISYRSHDGAAAPLVTNSGGLGMIHFEFFPIGGTTTPPPPPPTGGTVCTDTYESNNTISTAKSLPHNTTINAGIGSSTDEDWFSVRIWTNRYFRITLSNLPADYDIYLYSTTGELIRSLTTTGTTTEQIRYNDGLSNASYRVKIVGKNGVFDASKCYSLLLEAFSSPLANPTPAPAPTTPPPTDTTTTTPPPTDTTTTTPPPPPPPTDTTTTTPPPPTVCPDSYEPNNAIGSAKTIGHNTTYTASIGTATDEDWYTFRIWANSYFRVTISNLPADYDLYLYSTTGQLIRSLTTTGTTTEQIRYNDGTANTNYVIKVVGKNGAFDVSKCYSFLLEAFSSPLANPTPAPSTPPSPGTTDTTTTTPPPTDTTTTTPPPPATVCPDTYESNETIGAAKVIGHNTTYTASIGSSTDEDWYIFRIWANSYFKVSLWGLPADYDLFLYTEAGVLLASSENSGNTAEVINYNLGTPNTNYVIKVISKSGATVDPSKCYSFILEAFSSPLATNSPSYGTSRNRTLAGPMEEVAMVSAEPFTKVSTYPNPVQETMTINYPSIKGGAVELRVFDLTGRQILQKKVTASTGNNQFQLKVTGLAPGTYLLQMRNQAGLTTRKFQVGSK
ncbi:T9SS type A sorting domain-containing protein [Flavihumibacter fluvii]|uniref:T9SS type A sorting domain-containing protein n=1 Tax=Flavihumibacter fluvii TaxID=2838157 RepID=UPI001BDF1A2D|nr:T9SS type A sorting domain-containing protein [Flavihumibacter fluvii]ULQ52251.1 T9SS type A sorting domain-containing protein [Flavihumibacter fluvii]